ncbi:hypothetical protein ABT324_19815 [Saccharopolyspora sp. NPDC000359]|uniref:hypothetical protein n=1 Tax=Saccharopolyspora sp. NPDC000359 TaxID=3154251 RepID=UPI003329455C
MPTTPDRRKIPVLWLCGPPGVAETAAAQAPDLERTNLGTLRVDTTHRTAEQATDEVIARTGWPAT